jgi:hypothetical protein
LILGSVSTLTIPSQSLSSASRSASRPDSMTAADAADGGVMDLDISALADQRSGPPAHRHPYDSQRVIHDTSITCVRYVQLVHFSFLILISRFATLVT